jgi:hypothetical protein
MKAWPLFVIRGIYVGDKGKLKITSVSLPAGLHEIIKSRADFNRRSVTQEITYLVEIALASQTESTRAMIHMLSQLSQPPQPAGSATTTLP